VRQSRLQLPLLEVGPANYTEGFRFRAIGFGGKPNDIEFACISRGTRYFLNLSRVYDFDRSSLALLACSPMFSEGQHWRARF
jgi:hypothetical protein